jgi:hypothetical protein
VGVATSRSLQVMETHPRKQLARPKLEAPFVFSHRIMLLAISVLIAFQFDKNLM